MDMVNPVTVAASAFRLGVNWLLVTANCTMLYLCVSGVHQVAVELNEIADKQGMVSVVFDSASEELIRGIDGLKDTYERASLLADKHLLLLDRFCDAGNSAVEELMMYLDINKEQAEKIMESSWQPKAPSGKLIDHIDAPINNTSYKTVSNVTTKEAVRGGLDVACTCYEHRFKAAYGDIYERLSNSEDEDISELSPRDLEILSAIYTVIQLDIAQTASDIGVNEQPSIFGIDLAEYIAMGHLGDILAFRSSMVRGYWHIFTPVRKMLTGVYHDSKEGSEPVHRQTV